MKRQTSLTATRAAKLDRLARLYVVSRALGDTFLVGRFNAVHGTALVVDGACSLSAVATMGRRADDAFTRFRLLVEAVLWERAPTAVRCEIRSLVRDATGSSPLVRSTPKRRPE